ncbi:MAG: hypothetical protein ACRCYU_21080, partial [Nocardioides sp.]
MSRFSYRYIASSVALTLVALSTTSVASAAPEATVPNTELVVALNTDGSAGFSPSTAPFDSGPTALDGGANVSWDAGSDDDNVNRVVRTFDTFTYRADWNVNETASAGVVLKLTLTDPVTISDTQYNKPIVDAIWRAPLPDKCLP